MMLTEILQLTGRSFCPKFHRCQVVQLANGCNFPVTTNPFVIGKSPSFPPVFGLPRWYSNLQVFRFRKLVRRVYCKWYFWIWPWHRMFVNVLVRVSMKMCPRRFRLQFLAILPNRNRRVDVHLVGWGHWATGRGCCASRGISIHIARGGMEKWMRWMTWWRLGDGFDRWRISVCFTGSPIGKLHSWDSQWPVSPQFMAMVAIFRRFKRPQENTAKCSITALLGVSWGVVWSIGPRDRKDWIISLFRFILVSVRFSMFQRWVEGNWRRTLLMCYCHEGMRQRCEEKISGVVINLISW